MVELRVVRHHDAVDARTTQHAAGLPQRRETAPGVVAFVGVSVAATSATATSANVAAAGGYLLSAPLPGACPAEAGRPSGQLPETSQVAGGSRAPLSSSCRAPVVAGPLPSKETSSINNRWRMLHDDHTTNRPTPAHLPSLATGRTRIPQNDLQTTGWRWNWVKPWVRCGPQTNGFLKRLWGLRHFNFSPVGKKGGSLKGLTPPI